MYKKNDVKKIKVVTHWYQHSWQTWLVGPDIGD
jgi:hypothetical protein